MFMQKLHVSAGGSCRIPASVTGVVGFRPTTGCWPAADGIVPMTVTRDTVGEIQNHIFCLLPVPNKQCWQQKRIQRDCPLLIYYVAGVNARSIADVKLFNNIYSDCDKSYKEVKLEGLRIGYPKNFWDDLGEEVK